SSSASSFCWVVRSLNSRARLASVTSESWSNSREASSSLILRETTCRNSPPSYFMLLERIDIKLLIVGSIDAGDSCAARIIILLNPGHLEKGTPEKSRFLTLLSDQEDQRSA